MQFVTFPAHLEIATIISTRNNILFSAYQYAFEKKDAEDINSRDVEYDFYSVMHYGSKDFSKNKKSTISSKKEGITEFGNDKISNLDAKVVNLMYGCPGGSHFISYDYCYLIE